MPRKISKELMNEFLSGELKNLLNYVKNDNDLRLEVRREGRSSIYYKKGKALEIIGENHFETDEKYGNVPDTKLAKTSPEIYFTKIKTCINQWLSEKKERAEFDIQQKIAQSNQSISNKYLIIDMEYQFEQNMIAKDKRIKRAGFDLLGIDRINGETIIFEVKQGLNSLNNDSGIKSHILDFEEYLYGTQKDIFRQNLEDDIKNIVADKVKLGIINDYQLPENFHVDNPELVFIFTPTSMKNEYEEIFSKETKGMKKKYHTIFLDEGNYILL